MQRVGFRAVVVKNFGLPSVTVIVCTYNGSRSIDRALEAISKQVGAGEEYLMNLLVVDNASTDETAAVVEQLLSSLFNDLKGVKTKLISEPCPGIHNARRSAILRVTSHFCLLCDDDNELNTNYVQEAVRFMQSMPQVGAVGGRSELVIPRGSIMKPDWFDAVEHYYAVGEQLAASGDATRRGFLWGAGLFFRTHILQRVYQDGIRSIVVGRYGDVTYSGNDSELCFWIRFQGYKLWYLESLQFSHNIAPNRLNLESKTKLEKSFAQGWERLRLYEIASYNPILVFLMKNRIFIVMVRNMMNFFQLKGFSKKIHRVESELNNTSDQFFKNMSILDKYSSRSVDD